MTTARHESASDRVKDCDNLITPVSNECVTPARRAEGNCRPVRTLATPGSFVSMDTGADSFARVYCTFLWRQGVGGPRRLRGWMRHTGINFARAFAPGAGPAVPLERGRKRDILARDLKARGPGASTRRFHREGPQDAGDLADGDRRSAIGRRRDRCDDAGFGAAGGRTVLQGQVDRHDHRLPAGRLERHLCARARAAHRPAHSRASPTSCRRICPAPAASLRSTTSTASRPRTAPCSRSARRRLRSTSGSGTANVRFKTAELGWVGRVDLLINIVFMWHTSKVKTFADAVKFELTLSGTGAGSTVSIYPTVMNNVFGTKFNLIMGYRGSAEAQLAVERGEVEGHSTSWTAVKVGHPEWWPKKTISILVQFCSPAASGAAGHPDRGRSRAATRKRSRCSAQSWWRPRSAPPSSPRPACRRSGWRRCGARSTPP